MKSGRLVFALVLLPLFIIGTGVNGSFTGTGGAPASSRPPGTTAHSQALPDTLRKLPNTAFTSGEYLRFDVKYGFVTAGEARMIVTDTLFNGRKCHRVEFTLNTKPFFDAFFKIRDKYLTYIDSAGLFPWRFEQHIREGGFSRDFTADFDQRSHIATTSEGKYSIPPYVHDMMSALYYARTINYTGFSAGQKIHLQNFYKDSTYDLDVKFKGRQEADVDAGKFNCVIIEPLAKEGGLFKSDGKVYVWMSDDERRIPVNVSTKIAIGSIESELVEYVGLAGPLNARTGDN
jgi:hypothetical protein